jgi:agmatinase
MSESMPYAGVATFLKAPLNPQATKADGDVGVLGIPWDEGTTSRPGARYGPRALRDVSTFWAYRDDGAAYYDGEAGVELLGGVRFVDCGDVDLAPMGSSDLNHPRIGGAVRRIIDGGLFPLVLGGDHSVTYPVLKGLVAARDGTPVQLVHFDTHMDYWEDEDGSSHTHASPIIRAHEDKLVTSITQYGIRGLHTAADNIALAQERGVRIFWCEPAMATPVDELVAHLEEGADTYLTFDIDCLDPAIAPGTGTPEPGGFGYYDVKAILRAVAQRVNLVGMDLVEVAPAYDSPGQVTALHAVRLIFDTLGAAFAR